MPKVAATVEETEMIPDEAIRLRILANSDLEADQAVKRLIRDEVNKEITLWVEDLTSLDEARAIISSNIPKIEEIAERIIAEKGLDQAVSVKFGKAEFPTKLYGQYLYPAGEYEAIVVTLGEGEGANWWCVLFPPLCFLDFSNGTAVSQTPFEEGIEEPDGPVEKEIESSVKEKEVIKVPVKEKEETEISFEEKKGIESSVKEKEVIKVPVKEKEETEISFEEKKETESSVEEKEVIENPVEEKKEAVSSVEKKEEIQTPIDVQVESQSLLDDRKELEERSVLNRDQVAVQQESVYNGQEEEPIIVKSFFAELFSQLF